MTKTNTEVPPSIAPTYAAHNISEPVYKRQPGSIPFIQHSNIKLNRDKTTVVDPKPKFVGLPIQVYDRVPQTDSAPYVAHILKPLPAFHTPISTPYSQHFYYKKTNISRGESCPPFVMCDNKNAKKNLPQEKRMIRRPSEAPPFVMCDNKNDRKVVEEPPKYCNTHAEPRAIFCNRKDEKKNTTVYYKESESIPFNGHVLKLDPVIPPTIGGGYGSHTDQRHVPRDRGCGGPPIIPFSCNNKDYETIICNPCYDPESGYNLSSTYGPHGKYPCTKSDKDKPFEPIIDLDEDNDKYGKLLTCPPPKCFGSIKNKRCRTKKKKIFVSVDTTKRDPNDIPFGSIQNIDSCPNDKKLLEVKFGMINNKVGDGVKNIKKSYDRSCFSSISNNPHQIDWLSNVDYHK